MSDKSKQNGGMLIWIFILMLPVFLIRGKLLWAFVILPVLIVVMVGYKLRAVLIPFIRWRLGRGEKPEVSLAFLADENGHIAMDCPECKKQIIAKVIDDVIHYKCKYCGAGEGEIIEDVPMPQEQVTWGGIVKLLAIGLGLITLVTFVGIQIIHANQNKQHQLEQKEVAKTNLKKELKKLRILKDDMWMAINNIGEHGLPNVPRLDGQSDDEYKKRKGKIILDWSLFTSEFEIKKDEPSEERNKRFYQYFDDKTKAILKKLQALEAE